MAIIIIIIIIIIVLMVFYYGMLRYLCCVQAGGGEPAAYPGIQAVWAEGQGGPGEGAGAETQPAGGHPTQGAAGQAAGVSSPVIRGDTFMYIIDTERATHTRNVPGNMEYSVQQETRFLFDSRFSTCKAFWIECLMIKCRCYIWLVDYFSHLFS